MISRNLLENTLLARPRTKQFLLAFPVIVSGFVFARYRERSGNLFNGGYPATLFELQGTHQAEAYVVVAVVRVVVVTVSNPAVVVVVVVTAATINTVRALRLPSCFFRKLSFV